MDGGASYIETTSSTYTFKNLDYKSYNLYFYVKDVNGEISNLYVKKYYVAESPYAEVNVSNATVTTTSGSSLTLTDKNDISKYLTFADSIVKGESINNYSIVSVNDIYFIDIVSADIIVWAPGVRTSDTVIVKQYNGSTWEEIETEIINDNQMRIKLTQEGTIEILKLNT